MLYESLKQGLVGAECAAHNSMDSFFVLWLFIASNVNFDNIIFYLLNTNSSLVDTSKIISYFHKNYHACCQVFTREIQGIIELCPAM